MRLPGRHGSCRCLCRADEPGLGNNPGPDLVENGPADKTIRVLNAKTLEQKANLAFDGNPEDMLYVLCGRFYDRSTSKIRSFPSEEARFFVSVDCRPS